MRHIIYFDTSQRMNQLKDKSVDLVVTSPPYPMIEMWDEMFFNQNPDIKKSYENNNSRGMFELMHKELDKVWSECWRVLKDGSFLCINIGDATRTINGEFSLYNNHSRIVNVCEELGFTNLPNIIWKKVSNSPNKFMGSGMLPCGAYVTLEHEWILIFRKGGKRNDTNEDEKKIRKESSYFWEERNTWFSDTWDIKGVKQVITDTPTRNRNASYPIELPYRLINMYSQKGDVVLDPFVGLGTTTIASILSERNSVGYEIDSLLKPIIENRLKQVGKLNSIIGDRVKRHLNFVNDRLELGKEIKYDNPHLGCKVMTKQETEIRFNYIKDIQIVSDKDELVVESCYQDTPPKDEMSLF